MIDTRQIQAMGVLVLDEKGKLKTEKLGPHSIGAGAGIGHILAMLTPIGKAVGVIGDGIRGALHHKSLTIPSLGGRAETHELDDGVVAEIDAASVATHGRCVGQHDRMTSSPRPAVAGPT